MRINELEANELINLIKVLKYYDKHRAGIFMIAKLQELEVILPNGSVNEGTLKHLTSIEKKLKILLRQAKKIK